MISWRLLNQAEKDKIRKKHNPEGKPVGDFTGRCYQCHSSNLWDDNLNYGCNKCGMVRIVG